MESVYKNDENGTIYNLSIVICPAQNQQRLPLLPVKSVPGTKPADCPLMIKPSDLNKSSSTSAPSIPPQCTRRDPIWKRRNANPIKPLKLDRIICGDHSWLDLSSQEISQLQDLQFVNDLEWIIKDNHFEVHSLSDICEGVVINPPTFPAWYQIETTGKTVPALFPFCVDFLIEKAQKYGYPTNMLIKRMGTVVGDYSRALLHPRKRKIQEVLVLAGRHWQGVAGIYAANHLMALGVKVSVYIHGGTTKSEEEFLFVRDGGKIYTNLKDMEGRTFRVVVVALESQAEEGATELPLFGEWLQHSVAVFLDPPVIKSSYSAALQIACRGSYNISQRTVLFTPGHPKTYVIDKFIDILVVDIGIPKEVYSLSGMEYFSFNKTKTSCIPIQKVIPQPFHVKGSKITFYNDGKPEI